MICRRSTAGISLRCEPHALAWGYVLNSFHEQVAIMPEHGINSNIQNESVLFIADAFIPFQNAIPSGPKIF